MAGGLWETEAWQGALLGSLRISGAFQQSLSARFAVRHSRLLWARALVSVKDAEANLQQQFYSHKCEQKDARQGGRL
jgi:hypothetical protein